MSNPNLQKIIKLTQSQYNTLANGGTVGDFTGLNDNYLYLIQEDYEFPTTTTARKILMSTSTAGLVEWQSLTANDIPNLNASKINAGTFSTDRIPNLNASKINAGTFDIARIPTGTTASTVALGNHDHDSTYLKLSGGTVTGKLQVNALIFGYNYTNSNNRAAFMFDKPGSNYTGIGAHAEANTIYFGACNADGDWVDSYKQIWKFNGTIIEDGTSLSDKYLGISATAADSDKLNGQAASFYAPKGWVSDNYLGISAKAADSDKLDNHDSSYFINTSNIGSQSVNYATSAGSAGNADTVDNEHASAFAHIGSGNNLIVAGNEFNFISDNYGGNDGADVWINYTTPSRNNSAKITGYILGNGHGGQLGTIIHSGNIGSQSVNYASSSGNADTLDNHDSSYFYPASNPNSYTSVTELTVSGWGFTKNAGTVTQVKIGTTVYDPTSGVISLPAYPTTLPASDVYEWAKASTKPTYTASEVGALASDAKVVLYTSQSLTNIQKVTARSNIGAGTSDLALGNTATTAAAGNHTHTLSITSGGSSPTTLAANTTYTLTAGGSTLVFKTPAAGGGSAYYANQYNQWYYFSNSSNPYISSKIGLTSLTTYENSNLFFGFNSIPEDMQTSLGYGHNIKLSARSVIMDLAIGSGYMSQLVFGTIGYDVTKICARTIDAWGGYVGEPDEVSKLGELYLETSSLHGTKVVNGTRYEFNIGRRCHCIHFSNSTNHAFFNILTSDAHSYSSFSSAASILYNTGHRSLTSFLKATGIYGSYTKPVVGVFATSSSSLSIVYMNGTTVSTGSFSSGTVTDSDINTVYEP